MIKIKVKIGIEIETTNKIQSTTPFFYGVFYFFVSKNSLGETLNQPKSTGDVNELKIQMKEFSKIPGNPGLSQTYIRLFPHRIMVDLSTDSIGPFIQKDIVGVINQLISGEEMDATLGRILKYAFIQGIRPHELVAKKTNLSLSTYYRYLNKALERLYQVLAHKKL